MAMIDSGTVNCDYDLGPGTWDLGLLSLMPGTTIYLPVLNLKR